MSTLTNDQTPVKRAVCTYCGKRRMTVKSGVANICATCLKGAKMPNTTEAQQRRRLERRRCGNCQGKPDRVIQWGGHSIAICNECYGKLKGKE